MRRDAHGALIDALILRGGVNCRLVASRERPWASMTFEGARHVVELALPAAAAAPFLDGIEEAEVDLPGHLVADLAVVARAPAAEDFVDVRIEALTLVDPVAPPERSAWKPRLRDHG